MSYMRRFRASDLGVGYRLFVITLRYFRMQRRTHIAYAEWRGLLQHLAEKHKVGNRAVFAAWQRFDSWLKILPMFREGPYAHMRFSAAHTQYKYNGEEGKDGKVYCISDGHAVKVGHTYAEPEDRIRSMQCGNPRPLKLLASACVPDSLNVEKRLHYELTDFRTEGGTEWFYLTEQSKFVLESFFGSCIDHDA